MALDYDTLGSTVGDYLDRSDLDAIIPTFIELAEAKFRRSLRHWRMEKRATADTIAGERQVSLPTDFVEMRSLKRNSSPVVVLEILPPQVINSYAESQGSPNYFSVVGDELHLDPVPDAVYELEMYYYAFSALSDTNTTKSMEHCWRQKLI